MKKKLLSFVFTLLVCCNAVFCATPNFYMLQCDTICEDEYYAWHCQMIQDTANHNNTNILNYYTYFDSLTTISGGDSIYEFHLYVAPHVYTRLDTALCCNHRLRWFHRDTLLLPGEHDFTELKSSC